MKNKFALFILLSLSIPTFTDNIEPRLYKSAASLGMGGVGVSTIGYQFSAIRNPAALGLMTDHEIAPFLTVGASLNPEMISLLEKVPGIANGSKDFSSLDFDALVEKAPNASLNGPLNIGYMGKGFGIWTTTSSTAGMTLTENSNNILSQNGISVSYNNLAQAGSEVINTLNNGGSFSEQQLQKLFQKYIGQDLLNQGLTQEEADKTIKKIAADIKNNPEGMEAELQKFLPKAKLDMTSEVTVNLAYGYRIPFKFIDDLSGLSLGATVRFAQRFKMTTGEDPIDIDKLAGAFSGLTDNIYQASIVSSDFGASLRLENLIIGVAVRDALSTQFAWKNLFDHSSGELPNSYIPYSVDFGVSYRFYFQKNWIQEMGFYVEFENMTNPYSTWVNKLRIGSEFRLFNFLDLRVGMFDGFVTGGIGMGWKWFRIDFAYYREKYLNVFTSDQFYLNMTLGLDNSPQRKARALAKQRQHDQIQVKNLELLNSSLEGLDGMNPL